MVGAAHPQWVDGRSAHPLLGTWHMMIARCENPNHNSYRYYGARGVSVCPRWRADFWAFVADVGERPAGCTLDRIDPEGDYEPGNVRWATPHEQRVNRRPAEPRTHCKRNHEFTPANTYVRSDGRRMCVKCQREREALRRQQQRGRNPQ